MVEFLNPLLMEGQMSSAMEDIVVNAVTQIPAGNATQKLQRAQAAVQLLVTCPEFVIER
jgi:hypothetical protein